MGCFSFMCKECGKAILSNSFAGQKTKLFLLKNGEVFQEMEGEYDSYGRVFNEDKSGSIIWNNPFPELPLSRFEKPKEGEEPDEHTYWGRVCDLMFSKSLKDGIAAVHSKCFTGEIPSTQSESDPNQGWGENWEYMGDCDNKTEFEEICTN
jgi:hypothetical protein